MYDSVLCILYSICEIHLMNSSALDLRELLDRLRTLIDMVL